MLCDLRRKMLFAALPVVVRAPRPLRDYLAFMCVLALLDVSICEPTTLMSSMVDAGEVTFEVARGFTAWYVEFLGEIELAARCLAICRPYLDVSLIGACTSVWST